MASASGSGVHEDARKCETPNSSENEKLGVDCPPVAGNGRQCPLMYEEAPPGFEPGMVDLQSTALATWLRRRCLAIDGLDGFSPLDPQSTMAGSVIGTPQMIC